MCLVLLFRLRLLFNLSKFLILKPNNLIIVNYISLCYNLATLLFLCPSLTETDDPGAVLCLYKTDNNCVMKFTYSEHTSGQSILTALKEPGWQLASLFTCSFLWEASALFRIPKTVPGCVLQENSNSLLIKLIQPRCVCVQEKTHLQI